MISFKSDYNVGAHPSVLDALVKNNGVVVEGYGTDHFCDQAGKRMGVHLANEDCMIRFVSGGTQANLAVIGHLLRPYQAVISADTGHIASNETGAIEATGHKVITLEGEQGKITLSRLEALYGSYGSHHVVMPKMVYLSQPTELGTLYTKAELTEIRAFCDSNDLLLYLDGARLASALGAKGSDLTLKDYVELAHVFTIGGTKCGALFGEAIVFANASLGEGFSYTTKQRGALLAKGQLLGIQFAELFREDLYLTIGRQMNQMSMLLREGLESGGYQFAIDSVSNQQFVILPKAVEEKLAATYGFQFWSQWDEGHNVVRLVTSWATTPQQVDQFVADACKLSAESDE